MLLKANPTQTDHSVKLARRSGPQLIADVSMSFNGHPTMHSTLSCSFRIATKAGS